MDRVTPQLMSFEEFLEWHPDDGSISELITALSSYVEYTIVIERLTQ